MNEKITLTTEQLEAWANQKKRLAFLGTYANWEEIGAVPELGIRWYRYDLPDGGAILAMSYPHWYKDTTRGVLYYHQRRGYSVPNLGYPDGKNSVADVLKDLKTAALKGLKA